jgi:lipopolysaccharide export system protein LptA
MRSGSIACLIGAAIGLLGLGVGPAQSGTAAAPTAAKPAKPPPAAAPAPAPAPPAAAAPRANTSVDLGAGSGPIDITSDDGIEMQQANKVYIASGNAVAKRGDRTLYGDTLSAYYRDIPNSSDTEIWRVVADGHVRITTPTQTVEGDHGVYDLDSKTAVLTGKHLKLTTPRDVVTARDALEWYDDKQFAVARGNAVGIRDDRQIRADVLTAQISQAPGEDQRISIVNGAGHVVATRPDMIGLGDTGVYDMDTGVVTLNGHVTLTHGQSTMHGDYGVADLEKGVSRLLPRPATAANAKSGRVQGYLVPRKKTDQPPGAGAKPAAPDAAAEKAAPGAAK